jgi:hypothetical protein
MYVHVYVIYIEVIQEEAVSTEVSCRCMPHHSTCIGKRYWKGVRGRREVHM